ncbi:MAG: putative Ig domain-containing protein, partial [Intrasporangium sp.]|uniref:putative Ig domain-containing protein n=1 Tax=Intrasporangium sp. TaxID=1925024 RepID=UPI003F804334
TSADRATFTKGSAGSYTVTTTAGFPTATTITKTGALPSGVSFTDNGDGTATLAGTPTAAGTFPLTITASNGIAPETTQAFMIRVRKAAAVALPSTRPTPAGTPGDVPSKVHPGQMPTVTKVAAVALPSTRPMPAGTLVGVPSKVRAGQVLTVTGSGYRPGALIEIGWYDGSGKRRVLAHGYADATGRFSVAVTVADDLGAKTVVAAGRGVNGAARYLDDTTVVTPRSAADSGPTPPNPGQGSQDAVRASEDEGLTFMRLATDLRLALGAALVLVMTGVALTVRARRRRHETETG